MKNQPQLPPPQDKLPRDAARAVKRKASLNIETVRASTRSALLGLPGLRVTHFAIQDVEQQAYLHLFCEHTYEVALYPRYQQVTQQVHEVQERCARHLDIWGMRTWVYFPQRRFECRQCALPFTEDLPWPGAKRRQTLAFEQYIYERVKHKTPRKQVALQEGLHEAVVAEIFKRHARRACREQTVKGAITVLGMDEIAVRKGHKHYALVLSDIARRQVLAVLPNRLKATFELRTLYLLKEEFRTICNKLKDRARRAFFGGMDVEGGGHRESLSVALCTNLT